MERKKLAGCACNLGGISSMKPRLAYSKVKRKHQMANAASAGGNRGGFRGGLERMTHLNGLL